MDAKRVLVVTADRAFASSGTVESVYAAVAALVDREKADLISTGAARESYLSHLRREPHLVIVLGQADGGNGKVDLREIREMTASPVFLVAGGSLTGPEGPKKFHLFRTDIREKTGDAWPFPDIKTGIRSVLHGDVFAPPGILVELGQNIYLELSGWDLAPGKWYNRNLTNEYVAIKGHVLQVLADCGGTVPGLDPRILVCRKTSAAASADSLLRPVA